MVNKIATPSRQHAADVKFKQQEEATSQALSHELGHMQDSKYLHEWFCFQYQDSRIRVWRHHSECLLAACIRHRLIGLLGSVMHKGARPYAANIVRTVFDTENVRLLTGPSRSSDRSPIENIWFMVAE
ncbi:hypothetical protein TNCV_3929921 [Trichonephila clavipes]|nr:hypothetical protein TNCV_3929921 [Trichonephila clavipes]